LPFKLDKILERRRPFAAALLVNYLVLKKVNKSIYLGLVYVISAIKLNG
jgi:hypothetical protein